jgi:hypothetical protein
MKKSSVKNCLIYAIIILYSPSTYASQSNKNFSKSSIIKINGFVNSNGAYANQESNFSMKKLSNAQYADGVLQNNTGTKNKINNNLGFSSEAEINIEVSKISEHNITYGGVVELEANTSSVTRNENFNADKAYIFTENFVGRLELGNNMAVGQKMKVGPERFARGAGGINGKYLEYVNFPMLVDSSRLGISQIDSCGGYQVNSSGVILQSGNCQGIKLPRFILIPQLPVAHGGYAKGFYNRSSDNNYNNLSADDYLGFNKKQSYSNVKDGSFGDLEDATKISYYSPRISGWQLGVSAAPDSGNNGTSSTIHDVGGNIKNLVSYGINYSRHFGSVSFAASLTGENGKYQQRASNIERNDLKAYEVGFMASYLGFIVGATYGNWQDSLQPKSGVYSCNYNSNVSFSNQNCSGANAGEKFDNARYYTAGIAYSLGPIGTSLTYIDSNFQENKYDALSFGVDYKVKKGLMPYFEVTKFDFASNQPRSSDVNQLVLSKSERQLKDNEGYVVLAGLLFSF